METRLRSAIKSVVWRVIGIILLGYISYAFTGNWEKTTAITLIFHGIRLVTYYWHERFWDRVRWGRNYGPTTEGIFGEGI